MIKLGYAYYIVLEYDDRHNRIPCKKLVQYYFNDNHKQYTILVHIPNKRINFGKRLFGAFRSFYVWPGEVNTSGKDRIILPHAKLTHLAKRIEKRR